MKWPSRERTSLGRRETRDLAKEEVLDRAAAVLALEVGGQDRLARLAFPRSRGLVPNRQLHRVDVDVGPYTRERLLQHQH
jgi:hypothetical protein